MLNNIPIAASHILSCLIFSVFGRTSYVFSIHNIAYPTGASVVFMLQFLIYLSMDQGIDQVLACANPENFVRGEGGGFNSDNIFSVFCCFVFVDEGRGDPNSTNSGPSSALQRNAIKWRFAGWPMMVQL